MYDLINIIHTYILRWVLVISLAYTIYHTFFFSTDQAIRKIVHFWTNRRLIVDYFTHVRRPDYREFELAVDPPLRVETAQLVLKSVLGRRLHPIVSDGKYQELRSV